MAQITSTQNFTTGLTLHQIELACPSVFASSKHASRSERYSYLPTSMVLQGLMDAGFVPVSAMQAGTRRDGQESFTKHLLRLRQQQDLGMSKPELPEVVLVNSHDGSTSYRLYGGVFRCACINGLIVGDIGKRIAIKHTGDIVSNVVEGSLTLVEELPEVMDTVQQMKCVVLSRPEQELLAEYAMKARFDLDDEEQEQHPGVPAVQAVVPYRPEDFLRLRRYEDQEKDLWTTMNRIQENLLKGGISRRDAQRKKHTTRKVRGIDQTVKVNTLLWEFSQRMLELKTGASIVEACPF